MHDGQASDQAESSIDRSRQHSLWWRRIWNILLTPAYDPRFPPGPLQRPLVGYLAAILMQIIVGICMILLMHASPNLRLPAGLILLAVPLAALFWGTGPSILAAFVGIALLLCLRFNHYFPSTALHSSDIVGIFLYLIIGLTISLLASQNQNTRYRAALEANRLRRYYAELIAQLLAERRTRQASERKLYTREKQLEAILEVTSDAIFILDALGAPPQMNQAARDLLGLTADATISPTLEELFDLFDARGQPLSPAQWPWARLLRGERLYTSAPGNILMRSCSNGQMRLVTMTGMPLRDENNAVVGAILICHNAAEHPSQ